MHLNFKCTYTHTELERSGVRPAIVCTLHVYAARILQYIMCISINKNIILYDLLCSITCMHQIWINNNILASIVKQVTKHNIIYSIIHSTHIHNVLPQVMQHMHQPHVHEVQLKTQLLGWYRSV